MSDPTQRFTERVANYVKYRPDYPAEILALFGDEMNLTDTSVIADIGSGTGISAKMFLENGNQVFGIEPNQAMREASTEFLRNFPKFYPLNGTAENTTLSANSVDIIIAAQAFHWFDRTKTGAEFRRVLRGKGFVALIWNERQLDSNDFLREYERFLLSFGNDYEKVRHDRLTIEVLRDIFQIDFQMSVFQNTQTFDFEGLKGRILSSSYMPSEEHSRFPEMRKELGQLFTKHQKNDIIDILYDTKVFYGQF